MGGGRSGKNGRRKEGREREVGGGGRTEREVEAGGRGKRTGKRVSLL